MLTKLLLHCVRFEVFTTVTMKKADFWGVAQSRSLPLTSFTDASGADFLIFPFYPEDGGDTFLRNVG
jgi:hypothetical protein